MKLKISVNFVLFIMALSLQCFNTVHAKAYGEFKEGELSFADVVDIVAWSSLQGQQRLARSQYKNDFFQLANNFQPQANPLYCGIASSVIVLNTLRLKRNAAPSQKEIEVTLPDALRNKQNKLDYPSYSQQTFLNKFTDSIKSKKIIELKNKGKYKSDFDPGLSLSQLKGMLEFYKTDVELFYASHDIETGSALFRQQLKKTLKEDDSFILVNFLGKSIGAPTDGHISPLAAYDTKTDSVMVLDVAGYLNPWYWVPVEHLYQAMHTKDGNNFRGYLVVSESRKK